MQNWRFFHLNWTFSQEYLEEQDADSSSKEFYYSANI